MRFKSLIKIGQTLNFIHLEIFIVSFEKYAWKHTCPNMYCMYIKMHMYSFISLTRQIKKQMRVIASFKNAYKYQ